MQPVTPNAIRYDRRTMFFHWATFGLVVLQFVIAWTIDDFPRGPLRVDARSAHITVGLLLAALLVGRIFWRATEGRRLPAADRGVLHVIAKGTHWSLYVLLLAMVTLGVLLAWVRGDSLYNLFSIPSFAPDDRALRDTIQELHANVGWAIIALAGLHAAAGLVHGLLWRDGVLRRMLPGSGADAGTVVTGAAGRGAAGGD